MSLKFLTILIVVCLHVQLHALDKLYQTIVAAAVLLLSWRKLFSCRYPSTSENSWNVRIEELVMGIMIIINSLVMAAEFEFSGGNIWSFRLQLTWCISAWTHQVEGWLQSKELVDGGNTNNSASLFIELTGVGENSPLAP